MLLQRFVNQNSGGALAEVESTEFRAFEVDGVLVAGDEVNPNIPADVMRGGERGADTATEYAESAGSARDIAEREVGRRQRVVAGNDELAYASDSTRGGLIGVRLRASNKG